MIKNASSRTLALFLSAMASFSTMNAYADKAGPQLEAPTRPHQASLYDETIAQIKTKIQSLIKSGVPVPVPEHAGGGYTHEQHKENAKSIYEAGMLYNITGDDEYRQFTKAILLDYADLYPKLDFHPKQKEQSPGRLFWQSLNEAVWLVYVIQGYEQIKNDIDENSQRTIESNLLRPMAEFLSTGQPETFNKIHNHGTWATAAVGMTGYVLGNPTWVDQALLGLEQNGEAGFLKQLDELFSPDGYYAEGPYYQRYALMPFVLFAQAIHKNEAQLDIYNYREGIIQKAVYATIQQSYMGRFFPINDAIREKGLDTVELEYAIAILYSLNRDSALLSIAKLHDTTIPTPEGLALSRDLKNGLATEYEFKSTLLRDGSEGRQGALAILRSNNNDDSATVVFKPTSQGLGHGHFDRLGVLYYDNGNEILADYGAVRFLNVEPKDGGRYLPENESWAKQTVAHNAPVVDQESHYSGDWKKAQKFAPEVLDFHTSDRIQYAAAQSVTAYEGVVMQRLVAMVRQSDDRQYIVDIVRLLSEESHDYDLPIHFKGQLIDTSFGLENEQRNLEPFGNDNGYHHLWRLAQSEPIINLSHFSWLVRDQFYTVTIRATEPITAYYTQLGANDPNNNLRREQAMILRAHAPSTTFISVYEPHGRYDNAEEVTVFEGSSIVDISQDKIGDVDEYSIVNLCGDKIRILWSNDTQSAKSSTPITSDTQSNSTSPITIDLSSIVPGSAQENHGQ